MQNPLEMSDEDFEKMAPPPREPVSSSAPDPEELAEFAADPVEEPVAPVAQEEKPVDPAPEPKVELENPLNVSDEEFLKSKPPVVEKPTEKPAEKKEGEEGSDPVGSEPKEPEGEKKDEPKKDEPVDPSKKPAEAAAPVERTPEEYKSFHDEIMKPFKANGKTIQLTKPEDAIKLMQMGANYTRKMQDLQPHRKKLLMLENNGIDEDTLSYLIDLQKKNPEAIKKLIIDSGIDPLEIDTTVKPTYAGGAHIVPDQDVNLITALDDLKSKPNGIETITEINSRWDEQSKTVLGNQPDLLELFREQRETGVYDQIVSKIEQMKMLGDMPANIPFLQAYKVAGDLWAAEVQAAKPVVEEPKVVTPPVPPQPVATKVAAPKPVVENSDKASAASSTRSTPKAAKPFINYLAMSDEEFMKLPNVAL